MDEWVRFYERVFGMTEMIHFTDRDISTEYSALMSKVMADGKGRIKFPINEPAEGKRKSQIDEYLDYYGGPGRAAYRPGDDRHRRHRHRAAPARRRLPAHARELLRGAARAAIGEIDEDMADLRRAGHPGRPRRRGLPAPDLHASRSAIARPLFLEVIERHGARGFGEGNFKALFEAIEREQEKRGNL